MLSGRIPPTAKTNAWIRPVVILVNHETRGGAEALAAALRYHRAGVLIGGPTAGSAAVFKEVPLPGESGNRLRFSVAAVMTPDGISLSANGVEPDLLVTVRPEHDRAYLADPYTTVLSTGAAASDRSATNVITSGITVRKRVSEADLVRQKKEIDATTQVGGFKNLPTVSSGGSTNEPGSAPRPTASELAKIIKDPVLGRALDLLKGLSLLSSQNLAPGRASGKERKP